MQSTTIDHQRGILTPHFQVERKSHPLKCAKSHQWCEGVRGVCEKVYQSVLLLILWVEVVLK